MVNDRDEAVRQALAQRTNTPDTCQMVTRTWCGVPSAGDYDGDGSADAEDGWKSEPVKYRHTDRNPPAGVPVSYLGGSRDNGHRALSLGNGLIRSTDAGGRGVVATVDILWPVRAWGLQYAGWSETCDGVLIPAAPEPERAPAEPAHPYQGKTRVHKFLEGGPAYDMRLLRDAAANHGRKDAGRAVKRINQAVRSLPDGGNSPRVALVKRDYAAGTLRVGALRQAAKRNPKPEVQHALDEILAAINDLRH